MTESPHSLAAGFAFSRWRASVLLSLAVSLAIVSPFFWLANASGHDIQFHASSWLDVAAQWKEGILFPRWCESANYGYGEPRFIFYPPLSWLLGATLTAILPLQAVAGAFIVLAQTLAGTCAYALVRRFVPHRTALLGAACFAANPYALLIIYLRSDYAELLAMALFPLVLLACLELCGLPAGVDLPAAARRLRDGQSHTGRSVALFAIPFATVWLSNAPAAVVASYSVAFLFAWAALAQKSWKPLARGAAGLALGFALSAFYLVPAAYEQRWVNIGQVLSTGLAPADNFIFTSINDPDHNAFNRIASSVAVLTIVLTLGAILAAWRRLHASLGSSNTRSSSFGESSEALTLLAAASSLLMFRFTHLLWMWLPKLRFVQFPWRWMSMLGPVLAVFFAAAVAARRRAWIWMAVLFLLYGATAAYLARAAWWDQDDFPFVQDAIAQGQGFEGTDEYDPRGDDHLDLPQNQPRARVLPAHPVSRERPDAAVRIARWTAENRLILVDAREPVRLAVRLLDYPAWRVTLNGKPVVPLRAEGTAAMFLPLKHGDSRVEIRFTRTRDRTLGDCISALALVAAFFLVLRSENG